MPLLLRLAGRARPNCSRLRTPKRNKYLYPMLRGEKKVFFGLSEPSGGSDPGRSIQTRAVRDGDHWVLNGTKLWD